MKYITFAIPCYNSQDYMEHAIESILKGGENVEIIIVNDGSSDQTEVIGQKYVEKYPTIVKLVTQENGGHGEAVNTGLVHATGHFFKVVDSDDWVEESSLVRIIEAIRGFVDSGTEVDMILSNYVYEKEGVEHKKVVHYRDALPVERIFTWNEVKRFHVGQYILMHSVCYRTEMLRLCQLQLPKHTFYVDNIYVYYPLPNVRKMYYIDTDFYRYFIGREDQSVNEKVMIGRVDQQIFVTKTMINMYELRKIQNRKLRKYMMNYLAIMMTVSSILLIRSKKSDNLQKKQELWAYLKWKDTKTYFKIRYGILGQTMNLPGRPGRKVSSMAYVVARRIFGFN